MNVKNRSSLIAILLAAICLFGSANRCWAEERGAPPLEAVAAPVEQAEGVLFHLPGIGGHRRIDQWLVTGLGEGGVRADATIYDWTGAHSGLAALYARAANEKEAAKVADRIAQRFREAPQRPIYLTGHSGGSGIAVWALERLPEDVYVESAMLIASALSPGYDLTQALSHVRGKLYVVYSSRDPVLGAGTSLFQTIDGVRAEAMGRVGVARPQNADADLYNAKVVPIPYDPAWMRFRNAGDHIGPMMRPFAKAVLAPLLLTGQLPKIEPVTRVARQTGAWSAAPIYPGR